MIGMPKFEKAKWTDRRTEAEKDELWDFWMQCNTKPLSIFGSGNKWFFFDEEGKDFCGPYSSESDVSEARQTFVNFQLMDPR